MLLMMKYSLKTDLMMHQRMNPADPILPNNASTREQTTNPPNPKTCMMSITDSPAQTYSRRPSPTRHQGPDGVQGPTSCTRRDPCPTAPPPVHSRGLRYKPPSQPPKPANNKLQKLKQTYLFGSPSRLCKLNSTLWTLYTALHLSLRISRHIRPLKSTLGW